MSILRPCPPPVKPARRNPRDSWPAWTDSDRWELGPDPDDTRDHSPPFEPSPADEAERLAILSEEGCERDSALSDALTEYRIAEREREANLATLRLQTIFAQNPAIGIEGHTEGAGISRRQ